MNAPEKYREAAAITLECSAASGCVNADAAIFHDGNRGPVYVRAWVEVPEEDVERIRREEARELGDAWAE